jgi:hypothetical protein
LARSHPLPIYYLYSKKPLLLADFFDQMHMLEDGVEKLAGAANFRNKLCTSVHVLLHCKKKIIDFPPFPSRDVTTGCRPSPPFCYAREGR